MASTSGINVNWSKGVTSPKGEYGERVEEVALAVQ